MMDGWLDGWMDDTLIDRYLFRMILFLGVFMALRLTVPQFINVSQLKKLNFSGITSTPGFAEYIQAVQIISIISEPHVDDFVA
jgi:Na+/alanine symporter